MRACVVTFKECWQDADGRWLSYGGFPLQMAAIGSLFDELTLLVVRGRARRGGMPLPAGARVVAMREPAGENGRRKLSVVARLPYYLSVIAAHIRRADVVHVPLPGDLPLLGMGVALALGKPLLARYGSSWVTNSQTTLMNRLTRASMRRLARGRHVMLATGDGEAPPAPGVEWVFATALSRQELAGTHPELDRAAARPPRLVYAGRLSPEKGVDVLLRALAQLDAPRPRLTIAGDGPERPALEALASALGLGATVTFAGQLDREGLARAMGEADVCVQPSRSEGFSKAWLDAMAHGLPVVASAVGAARSALGADGERGWLVPADDVDALAGALRRLGDTGVDWPALRRRCRDYAESRTLEAWAQRIGESCARRWRVTLADGRLRA